MRESRVPGEPTGEERRALVVCGGCPVLGTCRTAVLAMAMPYGVAGGMTAVDRRAIQIAQVHAQASGPAVEVPAPRAAEPAPRPVPLPTPSSSSKGSGSRGRQVPPPSRSAPTVTPAALAVLNRTPAAPTTTRKRRTAPRVAAPAPTVEPRDPVEELIADLLQTYPGALADRETVRALVLGRGPATASRWEVAIAAMVMLARDTPAETTARLLGEDGKQVRRWRERRDTDRPLVQGGPGTGTHQLTRPARLVAATSSSSPTSTGASLRGAA